MTRGLYRFFLWLHPAEYAEHFSDEMLWIFELRRANEFGIALLLDCLCRYSAAGRPARPHFRHWLVSQLYVRACLHHSGLVYYAQTLNIARRPLS